MRVPYVVLTAGLACLSHTDAVGQSRIGSGNDAAVAIADRSPLVQSARRFLETQAGLIRDPELRAATLDIISSPAVCVTHRAGLDSAKQTAILKRLSELKLLDDETSLEGVFPPLINDGAPCPKLPQPFYSAPGSSFGGHHSYPGGLMLHEAANEISALNLAEGYRRMYGSSGANGLPVVSAAQSRDEDASDVFISQDILIAAPIWHDWAKTFVFQWNSDGTEFPEFNFGGMGAAKTGAHHILGIAEAIKRGLPPHFVIALASAHSTIPERVAGWIRTAAIIAAVDPVARGYLPRQLPVESFVHNLSDADFTFTGPAMVDVDKILGELAPKFGFKVADGANYNNGFRNVVLSYFSAERLWIIYGTSGLDGLTGEIEKIRPLLIQPTPQSSR